MSSDTDFQYVTLVSSDGFSYVISREAALVSGTLRGMLSSNSFLEAKQKRVNLSTIEGILLEKVCEYLNYNVNYKDATDPPAFDIPPEYALELLMTADYLDGKYNVFEIRYF